MPFLYVPLIDFEDTM